MMEIMPLIRDFVEDCARMVLNVKYENYKDLAERGREIGAKIVDVRKTEMQTVKSIKSNSRVFDEGKP